MVRAFTLQSLQLGSFPLSVIPKNNKW